MRGWRRGVVASVVVLGVYMGLAFLNSPRGFLGTDTGGKVATFEVMAERGRFDPDVGYWAERWDPDGSLHPLAYTSHTSSGRWVNVTTLPALWVGWRLYDVGGYRAALLVPMAGSLAAAFAGLALLRRLGVADDRWAWGGFLVVALASPLTIYALDFWEHSLGVALMAWAVVLLVDARSSASRSRWVRVAGGGVLVTAAAVPLVGNEVVERAVVGSTIRASRVAGTAAAVGDLPTDRVREAAITLFGFEGSDLGIVLGATACGLLVLAAVRRDLGVAVVAAVAAGGLFLVRVGVSGLGFVPGLATAWILPAHAAGRPSTGGGDTAPRRFVLVVALGAVPLVLATQFRGGAGPQWAGRYLLTSGLLLAVVGWSALAARPAFLRAAFVGLAVAVTAFGLAWTRTRTHDVERTIAALETRPEPVLVSGVFHLAREGGATYGDKRWLTLGDRGADVPEAADVLQEAGVDTFVAIDLAGDEALDFPGFVPTERSTIRLFDGVDLRVTRWEADA